MKKILFLNFCFAIILISCNNEQNKTTTVPSDSLSIKEKLLESDSLNFPLREEVAVQYYNKKNLEKAVFHLKKLCVHDTDNVMAFITLGNIYYDSKQFSNAILYYEKALFLDTYNTNLRCDLATSYLNINNAEKALELLKENIKIDYNHIQSHYNMYVIYKNLGKDEESTNELEVYNKLLNSKNN